MRYGALVVRSVHEKKTYKNYVGMLPSVNRSTFSSSFIHFYIYIHLFGYLFFVLTFFISFL